MDCGLLSIQRSQTCDPKVQIVMSIGALAGRAWHMPFISFESHLTLSLPLLHLHQPEGDNRRAPFHKVALFLYNRSSPHHQSSSRSGILNICDSNNHTSRHRDNHVQVSLF